MMLCIIMSGYFKAHRLASLKAAVDPFLSLFIQALYARFITYCIYRFSYVEWLSHPWHKCCSPSLMGQGDRLWFALVVEVFEMAYRDRSQGIAFVYAPIRHLLKDESEASSSEAFIDTKNAPKINLNKDPLPAPQKPEAQWLKERGAALSQIRENLDRLQSLHHKLHTMLGDINSASGKKKK